MSTDRSQVVWEAYPGATNDIDVTIDRMGGWVCEQHPDRPWPHDDCEGPGMPRNEHGPLS